MEPHGTLATPPGLLKITKPSKRDHFALKFNFHFFKSKVSRHRKVPEIGVLRVYDFHKDSEKREEIKLKIDEKKVIDENKKKFKEGSILKKKNPSPYYEKMRWKIIDFHPMSGNPQGKIIIDLKGKHVTISSNILLNFKDYEIDDKYINK